MAQGCCRVGDIIVGVCEANTSGHPRDFTGVWVTGSDTVRADNIEVIRQGDIGVTDCGHTIIAAEGSSVVDDNGIPIHRVGDVVIIAEGGVGVSVTGSETVFLD